MKPKYKVGDKVIVYPIFSALQPELILAIEQHKGNCVSIDKIETLTLQNEHYYYYKIFFGSTAFRIRVDLVDKYFKKSRRITFNFGQYGKGDRRGVQLQRHKAESRDTRRMCKLLLWTWWLL